MRTSATKNTPDSATPRSRKAAIVVGIVGAALLLLLREPGIDSYLVTDLGIAFSAALMTFVAFGLPAGTADTAGEQPRSSWGLQIALRSVAVATVFALANAIGRHLTYPTNGDINAMSRNFDPLAELSNQTGATFGVVYWAADAGPKFNWTGLLCFWVVYLAAAAIGATLGSLLQRIANTALRIGIGAAGVFLVTFFAPALYNPVFTTPLRPVPHVLLTFSTIFALGVALAVMILPVCSAGSNATSSERKGEGPAHEG